MDTIMLMDPGLASWSHRPSINGDVIVLSMCKVFCFGQADLTLDLGT